MAHPGGVRAGHGHRVPAAHHHVPGVQAEPEVGVGHEAVDLLRGFHQGADVRVQHRVQPLLGGPLGHRLGPGDQGGPLRVGGHGAAVVALHAGRRGEDQDLRARPRQGPGAALGHGHHLLDRVVQRYGQEARHQRHAGAGELGTQHLGVLGEPARGAELGGAEPELAHAGEHTVRRRHLTPARYLADPPADGGPGDPHPDTACRASSTGRPCRSDSPHAFAIARACRLSSGGLGFSIVPATMAANAVISAWYAVAQRSMKPG